MLEIEGGTTLFGDVTISGSKNSSLPTIVSTLLLDSMVRLENIPNVVDVNILCTILKEIGVSISENTSINSLNINAVNVNNHCVSDLAGKIRSSIVLMAPLLTRLGNVKIQTPGGCSFGGRPVNLHLEALAQMGAKFTIENNIITGYLPNGSFHGTEFKMSIPSMGTTQTIILAATKARGKTVIYNAAMEPEIVHLAHFLNHCGANICGAGTSTITIEGVETLMPPAPYTIPPDRIEAGTYALAIGASGGKGRLLNGNADLIDRTTRNAFAKLGILVSGTKDYINVEYVGDAMSCDISTGYYPDFSTDLQAPTTVLMSVARGKCTMTEKVWSNRFGQIPELVKMGAVAEIYRDTVEFTGVENLFGNEVVASDLRCAKALVIAGIIAKGNTVVRNIGQLKRGYENVFEKLTNLGAKLHYSNKVEMQ